MKKFAFLGFACMAALPTWADAPSPSAGSQGESCVFRSGFRAGVGLGYKIHSVVNKYQYTASAAIIGGAFPQAGENRQKTSGRQSAVYQVHAAYDWIKNNWLLGLEIDYRYNPADNKGEIRSGDQLLGQAPGDFIFKQTHRHDFGLGLRFGRLIKPYFALYGIANIRAGQFDYKFQRNTILQLTNANRGQFRWGMGLGVGGQFALGKGFSVAPEITYDIYQPIKVNQNLIFPPLGTFLVQSGRPKILNAIIKISKSF